MRKKKALARAFLSVVLVGSMIMNVLAVDTTTDPVEVETTGGNNEVVDVVITFEKVTENSDGSVTEEKAVEAENYVTESGMIVDYKGSSDMTTDSNGVTTGESESEYTVVNGSGTYGAEGGSETTIEKDGISSNITVDIPLTDEAGKNQNTVQGNTSQEPVVTGDPKDYPEDGEYDYTTTTVTGQGSVTVTTNDVTVTDTVKVDDGTNDSDLTSVSSSTKPTEDNDLYKADGAAPEQYLPGNETAAPAEGSEYQFVSGDGYQFEYVGSGNTSQFRPGVVFTEPLTDEQKVEQYGNHYQDGAFIHKDHLARYFVGWLDEEDRAKIPPKVNGQYVTDDAGYLLDVDGNRVLKNEWTVVGPDGKTYYLHRFDANGVNNYVEGWYQDGKWVEELNGSAEVDENGKPISPITVQKRDEAGNLVFDSEGNPVYVTVTTDYKKTNGSYVKDEDGKIPVSYGAVWSGAQQFVLVDKETGEVVTTYCADIATKTEMGFGYNIVNLEDSTYYSDEQAKQIRTIATNGYWGTTGTETDEEGNTVPKAGSLEAMKEMLRASGQFTEEELESLNDGVALSATQMAIWSCSNHMAGTEFVNTHYVDTQYTTGFVPQDKEDETMLMFKIYEYLTGLEPTEIEKPTTADTVINADNFLKDMAVTVIEKAEEHENNLDDDDTNDAYVTDLSFALVVTPSDENGDDLVIKVVDADGNVLASGRIAGENKEGESYDKLKADGNGNYTLSGITMVEGNTNFNITLEGVQNLKEGVYLYTSQIVTEEDEEYDMTYETSSQTMVGIANGKREVGVSMNLNFELSVEDEIVVTEHVWRDEWTDGGDGDPPGGGENPPGGGENPPGGGENPPGGGENPPGGGEDIDEIPDEDVPLSGGDVEELEEIPELDIPLANVPKTGDISALWTALSVLSGSGLLGLTFVKKREEE